MYTDNFFFLILLCWQEALEQCTVRFSITELFCFKHIVKVSKMHFKCRLHWKKDNRGAREF